MPWPPSRAGRGGLAGHPKAALLRPFASYLFASLVLSCLQDCVGSDVRDLPVGNLTRAYEQHGSATLEIGGQSNPFYLVKSHRVLFAHEEKHKPPFATAPLVVVTPNSNGYHQAPGLGCCKGVYTATTRSISQWGFTADIYMVNTCASYGIFSQKCTWDNVTLFWYAWEPDMPQGSWGMVHGVAAVAGNPTSAVQEVTTTLEHYPPELFAGKTGEIFATANVGGGAPAAVPLVAMLVGVNVPSSFTVRVANQDGTGRVPGGADMAITVHWTVMLRQDLTLPPKDLAPLPGRIDFRFRADWATKTSPPTFQTTNCHGFPDPQQPPYVSMQYIEESSSGPAWFGGYVDSTSTTVKFWSKDLTKVAANEVLDSPGIWSVDLTTTPHVQAVATLTKNGTCPGNPPCNGHGACKVVGGGGRKNGTTGPANATCACYAGYTGCSCDIEDNEMKTAATDEGSFTFRDYIMPDPSSGGGNPIQKTIYFDRSPVMAVPPRAVICSARAIGTGGGAEVPSIICSIESAFSRDDSTQAGFNVMLFLLSPPASHTQSHAYTVEVSYMAWVSVVNRNCPGADPGSDAPVCSGHGVCEQHVSKSGTSTYTCRCSTGWTGFSCTSCLPGYWNDSSGGAGCTACPGLLPSTGQNCTGHGVCSTATSGKCACEKHYSGKDCSSCTYCGEHGVCGAAALNCTCDESWGGPTCRQCAPHYYSDDDPDACVPCPGYPGAAECSGHGTCVSGMLPNMSTGCACVTGFSGPSCEDASGGDQGPGWMWAIMLTLAGILALLFVGWRFRSCWRERLKRMNYERAFYTPLDDVSAMREAMGTEIAQNTDAKDWLIPFNALEESRRRIKVGTGTSGDVYAAMYSGQAVAVKQMKGDGWGGELKVFLREACLLSGLHHPNIVRFFGVSFTTTRSGPNGGGGGGGGSSSAAVAESLDEAYGNQKTFYLVTELCEGSLGGFFRHFAKRMNLILASGNGSIRGSGSSGRSSGGGGGGGGDGSDSPALLLRHGGAAHGSPAMTDGGKSFHGGSPLGSLDESLDISLTASDGPDNSSFEEKGVIVLPTDQDGRSAARKSSPISMPAPNPGLGGSPSSKASPLLDQGPMARSLANISHGGSLRMRSREGRKSGRQSPRAFHQGSTLERQRSDGPLAAGGNRALQSLYDEWNNQWLENIELDQGGNGQGGGGGGGGGGGAGGNGYGSHTVADLLEEQESKAAGATNESISHRRQSSLFPVCTMRLGVARQIAYGMRFLHARRIVHRDLKPDNVLFDSDLIVKLCDFGMSRLTEKNKRSVMMTGEIGTPAYMAVELARADNTKYVQPVHCVLRYSSGCCARYDFVVAGDTFVDP